MSRFRHLRISLVDGPSPVRLSRHRFLCAAHYAYAQGLFVHRALFASREPPQFNLCLTVFPDDAGNGFTPQIYARAASFFKRSGLSPATASSVEAVCGPTPNWRQSLLAYLRVNLSSNSSSSFGSSARAIHRFANVLHRLSAMKSTLTPRY